MAINECRRHFVAITRTWPTGAGFEAKREMIETRPGQRPGTA
jgi:hypothetical protein